MFVGKVWKLLAIYPSIDIEQRDKAKFFEKKTKKQKKKQWLFLVFFKKFWKNNEHKFVFTKTIKLLALNFYEAI